MLFRDIRFTLTGRLHLNRQVIVLMSGLGVPNVAFFRLQEAMIRRLAQMLINEEQAAITLSQVNTAIQPSLIVNVTNCKSKSNWTLVYRPIMG